MISPTMTKCVLCAEAMIKTKSEICVKCFSTDLKGGLPKDR